MHKTGKVIQQLIICRQIMNRYICFANAIYRILRFDIFLKRNSIFFPTGKLSEA